jgi:drug/metabolite transporter (DMT)-like permease
MRWTTAGSVLIAVLAVRGDRLPGPRAWPVLALLGFLLQAVGNGAVVWAEQTVPSGVTAVLVATVPFWMVGIEALARHGDRPSARGMTGLVVGFVGIVVLVWPESGIGSGGRGLLTGVVATQFACVGWSTGSWYARRRGRTHPDGESVLAAAAFEMFFGGLALLVGATVIGEWSRLAFTPRTGTALAYLTLAGSVAAFPAYTYALKHLPVATVSLYAYINPVIAVALGTVLLNEPFGIRVVAGCAIVLAGVALVRRADGG